MKENTPQEEFEKRLKQGRVNTMQGYEAEKRFAKIFYDAGWTHSIPMRQASKLLDSCKLDLYGIPVNSQIKSGKQKKLNVRKILQEMREAIAELPPSSPEHEQHSIVIHAKTPLEGEEASIFNDIVSMTFRDYFKLLCMLHHKGQFEYK